MKEEIEKKFLEDQKIYKTANRNTLKGCAAVISRLNGGYETPQSIKKEQAKELIRRASWGRIKGMEIIPIKVELKAFGLK